MKEILKVQNLYKRYSTKAKWAVEDISFCCAEGVIVGLLGNNGAGKSTIIKSIEGMLPFEKGNVFINGYDIKVSPVEAKLNMGFVTDNHAVFNKMTGLEYVSFMADIYRVDNSLRKQRIELMQNVLRLGDSLYNSISSYSHGMKQKISMMGSLVHLPKLWILDEPMLGLDHSTKQSVIQFMQDYAKQGNTILFSSHDLNTVQEICNEVIVINNGKQHEKIYTSIDFKNGVDLKEEFSNIVSK